MDKEIIYGNYLLALAENSVTEELRNDFKKNSLEFYSIENLIRQIFNLNIILPGVFPSLFNNGISK
mgnify:CR=1 FL=1